MTAKHQSWINSHHASRITTEEFAKDSLENLLFRYNSIRDTIIFFSICRFKEVTGAYPYHITVVGFAFKQRRFIELHRHALRFPSNRFDYIGIDPVDDQDRIKDELVYSYLPFEKDLYGCHDPLRAKRQSRNPFHRQHSYSITCPELKDLLIYCPDKLFQGSLPW